MDYGERGVDDVLASIDQTGVLGLKERDIIAGVRERREREKVRGATDPYTGDGQGQGSGFAGGISGDNTLLYVNLRAQSREGKIKTRGASRARSDDWAGGQWCQLEKNRAGNDHSKRKKIKTTNGC